MKITSNVLKAIMAGAMVMSSVTVHAGEADVSVVQVTQAIQEATGARIAARYETMIKNRNAFKDVSDAFSQAEQSKAGFTVSFDFGKEYSKYSSIVLVAGSLVRYGMQLAPQSEFYRNMRTPTNVALMIGGVLVAVGYGTTGYSAFKIEMSEAEMKNATRQLARIEANLADDQQYIMSQAMTLGAKVENKIITGLPEGLKSLGSATVLDLNK